MNSAARLIFDYHFQHQPRRTRTSLVTDYATQCVQNFIVCATLCKPTWQIPITFIGFDETKHDGYNASKFLQFTCSQIFL